MVILLSVREGMRDESDGVPLAVVSLGKYGP